MQELIYGFFIKKVPRHIDAEYHQILLFRSAYYRRLNEPLQREFRLRVFVLLNIMGFTAAQMPSVTREMRVVIGSAVIEITFGLRRYLPTRFTNVTVLPRRYMYPGYGQPFLGHLDYRERKIFFSWADVSQGYSVPDDAVNVALHEMAHVIEAENTYTPLFNRFFSRVSWEEWAETAFQKMQVIRAGQHGFLKSYGGINMREMFAVCVETFFERPEGFKQNLPELYETMVELLRQDPTLPGNPLLDRGSTA